MKNIDDNEVIAGYPSEKIFDWHRNTIILKKLRQNEKKNELNIEEIKKLIPHRYPFLLIDKLIDIIPKESAVGVKNVTLTKIFSRSF